MSVRGWRPYANHTGKSNVTHTQYDEDGKISSHIWVRFGDGSEYQYTFASAGMLHVQKMKQLAADGQGLNGYINRYVRMGYAAKR